MTDPTTDLERIVKQFVPDEDRKEAMRALLIWWAGVMEEGK